MNVVRVILSALTFYNVGNDDWAAVATCAAIWAACEIGAAWTRWAERKERDRFRRVLRDANGAGPHDG